MKLLIIQPTVPHYRKEFFNEVAKSVADGVTLRTAPSIPGGPASIPISDLPNADYRQDCPLQALAGKHLYWQRGISLSELSVGDVLVLSGNPRFLSNYPLLWQARRRGIGVVWWGHGRSSTSSSVTAWLRRGLMRLADALLLYTDAEREQFITLGFSPDRVFATNNTMGSAEIDAAMEYWTVARLEEFRREHGLLGCNLLLFCGRLTEKSSFLLLLNAFSTLVLNDPVFKLAVVGTGDLLGAAQQLARDLGISDRVIWIGELHEEMQMAPWFLSAIAMVYPGAIGLSLLHALNYGLPVITHATLRRHNPEIAALENGVNGLLFAENDVKDLAGAIRRLADDPPLRQAMSNAALATMQGKYSTQSMVSGFVDAVNAAHGCAIRRQGAIVV